MKYVGGVFLDSYRITGGNALSGKVKISGAKNAALPILAASVMTKGENLLTSCPEISDTESMASILGALGCRIHKEGETLSVNADTMCSCSIPDSMMKKMRSGVFLAGALLTRCGEAVLSSPGGCDIGKRSIDIHIEGLKKLGAAVENTADRIMLKGGSLKGTDIVLPYPSVGATENIMMAAISAKGTTRIINSAKEPEIKDLQDYINKCGGKIDGAGTGIITVEGGTELHGCSYDIMPDRIEAGTYILMALATGGDALVEGIDKHLIGPLVEILEDSDYEMRYGTSGIWVSANGNERICRRIKTAPYPGFPTDLQPQMTAFLTGNGAGSVIEESIFEKRLGYAKQLKKMGADIEISEKEVIINSNNILCGAAVKAEDLRGGAALIISGLMAEGTTTVANTKYIKRGYSRLIEKIKGLGGEITEDEWRESNAENYQKKEKA